MDESPQVPAVRVLTRAQLIRGAKHDLPGAQDEGTMRTAYPGLEAGTFKNTMITMPAGQRSPARYSEIEHIIVVIEGSFVFTVDDVDYEIHELDQIFVPVGVLWSYVNAELGQSSSFSFVGP